MDSMKIANVVRNMFTILVVYIEILIRIFPYQDGEEIVRLTIHVIWGGVAFAYILMALYEWATAGHMARRRAANARKAEREAERKRLYRERASEIHRYYFGRTADD